MGKHAVKQRRALPGPKRLLVPAVVGVVTFGAVTAFAATLTVTSKTLGAGNASVTACNATAAVSYTTSYSSSPAGYIVATAPVTTGAGCNATYSYKVTLTGAGNASLAEKTGSLDASGSASPDFTSSSILASAVTGVSVVITN